MSVGGSPHGRSLGLMKCVSKSEILEEKVSLHFISDSGSAIFRVDKETSEYFVVGQTYEFKATQP